MTKGEMDSATLTILLRGEHLDMPDRIERGIWPHPPLAFEEVVKHLAAVLAVEQWFPFERRETEPNRAMDEWPVVERREPNLFIGHAQNSHPSDPALVLARGQKSFRTPEDAARWYLRWALHLPGDLDGWKVK